MNKNKITQLADFFYSSDDSNEIPLRLACVASHYTGFNLNREEFISLLTILSESKNLKEDLAAFKKDKEVEYGGFIYQIRIEFEKMFGKE